MPPPCTMFERGGRGSEYGLSFADNTLPPDEAQLGLSFEGGVPFPSAAPVHSRPVQ